MQSSAAERLDRAYDALEGLSVGDAFGERFFVHPDLAGRLIGERAIPAPPWPFTDDTQMARSIVSILQRAGAIDQDQLARGFAHNFAPSRGYGPAMQRLLGRLRQGEAWQDVAPSLFHGQGSFGNGAAMRVAPLGAYFADDLEAVIIQAGRSAVVTHTHPEAVAGAIAVAVAAAYAIRCRDASGVDRATFLDRLLAHVPHSEVASRIRRARDLSATTTVEEAVAVLGNGTGVSAQDTVPFALWCAATHLDNYEDALWLTVSGLGDRDTTCAIVGGIVASRSGRKGIPQQWLDHREPLPNWIL